ncbi:MAG: hypothetical protein CSB48_09655 [Proteobacteria bacterium]|nr:MAG: hypothetical protein CSB48_09655 [Pseudomonadota bacterium]PIE40484.1 MAG: hypothetical protein CSA51_00615 [Gammaproteobacteria bacterium]
MSESGNVSRATFDKVMVPNYAPGKIIPVRGSGSRFWDQQGREYLDFAGGVAVNSLGHAHPDLVSVLTEQAKKIWHVSNYLTNEPALRLAEKLTRATFADRVFFANSGAEANEAALKLARRYAWDNSDPEERKNESEGKNEILAFYNSFHGRTLFTVSVGGQEKYTEGFRPAPAGIRHVPFNDLEAVREVISSRTCAVIMEPVLGEGGVIPADRAFVQGVRGLCDQHHALLIFDEVQTGAGRTGELYAYMHYGVVPDILTTAKSMGGGFPVGAMLTRESVAHSLSVGTHGSTYGGNPLACAVAEKILDMVNTPQMLKGVRVKGEMIREGLERINQEYGVFRAIRGFGLLVGAELQERYAGRAPDFFEASLDRQLMILVAGPDVLRFAPALNITEEEIASGLSRLTRAIEAVIGK